MLAKIILLFTLWIPTIGNQPIGPQGGVVHLNCLPDQPAVVGWVMPAPGYIGSTSFYFRVPDLEIRVMAKALNTPIKGFLFGKYDPIRNYFLARIGWHSPLAGIYVFGANCLPFPGRAMYTGTMSTDNNFMPTPEQMAALQAAGYGLQSQSNSDFANEEFTFVSLEEMDQMAADERERFGLVDLYNVLKMLPES